MKRDGNIEGTTGSSASTSIKKSEGKRGKEQNFHSFFSNFFAQKRKKMKMISSERAKI